MEQKLTVAQLKKLTTIIGKLESLEQQVSDPNSLLRDAKNLLIKFEQRAS